MRRSSSRARSLSRKVEEAEESKKHETEVKRQRRQAKDDPKNNTEASNINSDKKKPARKHQKKDANESSPFSFSSRRPSDKRGSSSSSSSSGSSSSGSSSSSSSSSGRSSNGRSNSSDSLSDRSAEGYGTAEEFMENDVDRELQVALRLSLHQSKAVPVFGTHPLSDNEGVSIHLFDLNYNSSLDDVKDAINEFFSTIESCRDLVLTDINKTNTYLYTRPTAKTIKDPFKTTRNVVLLPLNSIRAWQHAVDFIAHKQRREEDGRINSYILDVVCLASKRPKAPKVQARQEVSHEPEESEEEDSEADEFADVALEVSLLGPAKKVVTGSMCIVERMKKIDASSTFTLRSTGDGRISLGHLARRIKAAAARSELYQSCVGEHSSVYILRDWNTKELELLSERALWESVLHRQRNMKKKDKNLVPIRVSVGEMKESDTLYAPLDQYDGEEEEMQQDIDFSTENWESPKRIRQRANGRETRQQQTHHGPAVEQFIQKCISPETGADFPGSLRCALTKEHYRYLSKFWKANNVEGVPCYEYWNLEEDEADTWPQITDLPPIMSPVNFDEKLFGDKLPATNTYYPGVDGRLQSFVLSEEQANRESAMAHATAIGEALGSYRFGGRVNKTRRSVHVWNQMSEQKKCIIVSVSNTSSVFDAVYNNDQVLKAGVRDWPTDHAFLIQNETVDVVCAVVNFQNNQIYHIFSIDEMKHTTTKDLFELLPTTPGFDPLTLELRLVPHYIRADHARQV